MQNFTPREVRKACGVAATYDHPMVGQLPARVVLIVQGGRLNFPTISD